MWWPQRSRAPPELVSFHLSQVIGLHRVPVATSRCLSNAKIANRTDAGAVVLSGEDHTPCPYADDATAGVMLFPPMIPVRYSFSRTFDDLLSMREVDLRRQKDRKDPKRTESVLGVMYVHKHMRIAVWRHDSQVVLLKETFFCML